MCKTVCKMQCLQMESNVSESSVSSINTIPTDVF